MHSSQQLTLLQSGLEELDEHSASTGAVQLAKLQQQQQELAAAAAAHRDGARHQQTLKGVRDLSEAASAAGEQHKSMLTLLEATLQKLSESQTGNTNAAEQSSIEQLEALKQLVHDELTEQKRLVDEQVAGLQESYECGVEGNREEELIKKLQAANENSKLVEEEQKTLIQQQADELAACKQQLQDLHSQQQDGRNDLKAELMSGIGAMIEQQVAGLADKFNNQYEQLDTTSSSLVQRNKLVLKSVGDMSDLRASDTAAVASEAEEWGEANREIGVMTQQAQAQGRRLSCGGGVMDQHNEKLSTRVRGLSLHTNSWADNNREVAEKTLAESVAASVTQQAVVKDAAVTQQFVQVLETETDKWKQNDNQCQQVLKSVDSQHNQLAAKISEDSAQSRQAIQKLAEGTTSATELNTDGIARVGGLKDENSEVTEQLSQFVADLSEARELEAQQDLALRSATAAVHTSTLEATEQLQTAAPIAPHAVPVLQTSQESLKAMESQTESSLQQQKQLICDSHQERSAMWSKLVADRTAAHTSLADQVETSLNANQAVVQQGSKAVQQQCASLSDLHSTQQTDVDHFHSSSAQQMGQLSTQIGKFCSEVARMDEPVAELKPRAGIECPAKISAIKSEQQIESEFKGSTSGLQLVEEEDHDILFQTEASPVHRSPAHRRSPQSMLVSSPLTSPKLHPPSNSRSRSKLQAPTGLQKRSKATSAA